MDIKVSAASSLFKENGHDLRGIFTQLSNAISFDFEIGSYFVANVHMDSLAIVETRKMTYDIIKEALEDFQPDLEKAEEEIKKFQQNYKELKEIEAFFENMGFWKFIFDRGEQRKKHQKRLKELQEMTVSVQTLLNVAYYKFSQINGTKKQFREGFERLIAMK